VTTVIVLGHTNLPRAKNLFLEILQNDAPHLNATSEQAYTRLAEVAEFLHTVS